MRKTIIILAAVLGLGAATARSEGDPRMSMNRGQETGAYAIDLPAQRPASISYPKCDDCTPLQFNLAANTVFTIGGEEVSYEVLRAEIAARPHAFTFVQLSLDRRTIEVIALAARNTDR
jgi:hypothetical protein